MCLSEIGSSSLLCVRVWASAWISPQTVGCGLRISDCPPVRLSSCVYPRCQQVHCTSAYILSAPETTDILHAFLSLVPHLLVEVGAVIGESSRGLNACLHRSLFCVRTACTLLGFWAKCQHLIVVRRSAVDVAEGVSQHSMGCEKGREEGVPTHVTAEGSRRYVYWGVRVGLCACVGV